MPFTLVGPEQLAPIATNNVGSPFYTRPNVFLYGTTRFAFVTSVVGTRRLRAFKRDNATGTWTQVDTGGGPTVSPSGHLACPTFIRDPQDANKILCAYPDKATFQLRLMRFDLVAETFGASTTALGPIVSDTSFSGNQGDDTGAKTCVAYRAATDSDLVLFQGPPETIGGLPYGRTYITEYDRASLTWSITPIQVCGSGSTTSFMPLGIVMGTDGVAHLFFTEMDFLAGLPTINRIWHAAVSTGLSVINVALAATDVQLVFELMEGYPRIRTIGAGPAQELLVPYISANPTQTLRRAKILRGDASTAPTWTTEVISTSGDDSPIGDAFVTPTCAIGDDGFPWAFWIGALNPTFAYTLWYSKGGDAGAGWDAPTALLTLDPNTGDFMEFPTVSELPGIGFGIVAMDFKAAAYLGNAEVNAYMEWSSPAPPPPSSSGWLPQYRKRINA